MSTAHIYRTSLPLIYLYCLSLFESLRSITWITQMVTQEFRKLANLFNPVHQIVEN